MDSGKSQRRISKSQLAGHGLVVAFAVLFSGFICAARAAELSSGKLSRAYDPDPAHPFNKLHEALFVRRDAQGTAFGHLQIDVLLWPNTSRHLLAGTSHEQTVKALRSFAEQDFSATRPAARALLQRDLWAAFDWATGPEVFVPAKLASARRELRRLLHQAIRKVALTPEQIQALPDTYQQTVAANTFPTEFNSHAPDAAFLPADLFHQDGTWLCIGDEPTSQGEAYRELAPRHVKELSRSSFAVFLRLPEGRKATLDYLQRLIAFEKPLIADGRAVRPSPELPEFPAGTQLVLLRRAMLVDSNDQIVPTRLVESLQIRTFMPDSPVAGNRASPQGVMELVLNHNGLLGGKAAPLRAVPSDEVGFDQFGQLADPFQENEQRGGQVQRSSVLESCHACHHSAGVHSFNVYTRSFEGAARTPPNLTPTTPAERDKASIYFKRGRHDWGVFEGLSERDAP